MPLFIAIVLIFAVWSTAAGAGDTLADLDSQVRTHQKNIQRLESGISEQKELVKESRSKEINLLSELEKIDQELAIGRDKLLELKTQLKDKEIIIHQKMTELSDLTTEKEKTRNHVKKRLAAYYRMGNIGVMNVTFSTSSLPELLNFKEYFQRMIEYDQKVILDYRERITALTIVQETLQEEKDRLLSVIVSVKNQETAMASVRQNRMDLLNRVNTEKKLYQQALAEMQEAATNLNQTIEALKQQVTIEKKRRYESPKKKRPGSIHGFAALKGTLSPPVTGAVATYFGRNTNGKFGITTYANGIDIKTISGAEIKAIYNGKVVFAGFLRGYGNLIILDHGQQYYSLMSRVARILKSEGDVVNTGEVIGIMNDQDDLLGEGLHFEIRHGTDPENPLNWVNNDTLKIQSSRADNN